MSYSYNTYFPEIPCQTLSGGDVWEL